MDDRFTGKRVHVIGLGAYGTGRETARVLAARGASVTVSDIKPVAALAADIAVLAALDIPVMAGDQAYTGIEKADLIVPSPGVPLDIPPLAAARSRGAEVVSEIEIAYRIARGPIIAVTGTKGKSTTTTLIGEILRDEGIKARVGGNIGRPLIALAEQAEADELLVAEVSSFQLEATQSFRPQVAVLLNLFPDHLDRHAGLAEYRAAKAKLFANQQAGDMAVISRDNPSAWAMRVMTRARVIPFSIEQEVSDGADIVEGWLRVADRPICPQQCLKLRGRHNLANALAALAAAQAAGATLARAEETLRRFGGLEHRLEPAGRVNGVWYINDSQATTPDAAIVALESFPEHVVLLAGGRPKVHDFRALAETIARRGADLVVLGEAAEEIAEAARAAGVVRIEHAPDLTGAIQRAAAMTRPGEVVLMSPACASFDMFTNMAERGRTFKHVVASLSGYEEAR